MALNAVERRLLALCGRWQRFADDAGRRLLVWEAPAAALRLVECFFEAQKHEAEYTTQDLFLILKDPFENSIAYSRALKELLAGIYDASRGDLAEQGLPADWSFAPESTPDSAWGFVRALRSFGGAHHPHFRHLVAVLMPVEVSDDAAFAGWVARALEAGLPERLRIAVVEPDDAPRLRDAPVAADARVLREVLEVDMFGVAQEVFAQEPASGPAAVFRAHLAALVALVEKGGVAEVRAKAADAFEVARAQGWDDQQVALYILVAGAQLKAGRHDDAVASYRAGAAAAGRVVEAGHPAGRKLVVQALFGEAGAHLAAGRPAEAGDCYDRAATVAGADRDLLLSIEALRMGGFCRARTGDARGALDRWRRALDVGARLRPEVRAMTTLPLVATEVLRALDPDRTAEIERLAEAAEAEAAEVARRAERQAAALERSPDRAATDAVLQGLEDARSAAWARAEARLRGLVAAGSGAFRAAFDEGRALLGGAWPLGEAAAVAVASPAPARAPAAGRRREEAPAR